MASNEMYPMILLRCISIIGAVLSVLSVHGGKVEYPPGTDIFDQLEYLEHI